MDAKIYDINGKAYRQEPLSWRQGEWLQQHVFGAQDLSGMKTEDLMVLLQAKAPLLLAICLIEEGQTRKQKAEGGFEAVQSLAEEIACSLTPELIKEISMDFFSANALGNIWQLINFHALAAQPTNSATGSVAASASSPAEIPSGANVS